VSGNDIEQRIVLLFGSGITAERSAALASEVSRLTTLLRAAKKPVSVSAISLGLSRSIAGASEHISLDESGPSRGDRLLTAVGAFKLKEVFATFPLGRLLNSFGPVDQSRVFWRAVKLNPDAMRLLKSVNVAIATDLPATKTAWLAVHRGWVDDAFYDHRSASVGLSWQLPLVENKPSD
jgi:hypothetical protein